MTNTFSQQTLKLVEGTNTQVKSAMFINITTLSYNRKKCIKMTLRSLSNKNKNRDTTYIQHDYLGTILRKGIWA